MTDYMCAIIETKPNRATVLKIPDNFFALTFLTLFQKRQPVALLASSTWGVGVSRACHRGTHAASDDARRHTTSSVSLTMASTRAVLQVFEKYQKDRVTFVQTVAELATRPQNIEPMHSAGVMALLRPLLLDNVPR